MEEEANWDTLLICFQEYRLVKLSDSDEKWYNFGNEILMRTMCNSLLEALHTAWTDEHGYYVRFGNKFFATMSVEEQLSFFHRIVALPVSDVWFGEVADIGAEKPAITIDTLALLDALGKLSPHVEMLQIQNVALGNHSDVKTLSKIILAKCETLHHVLLEGIECPIDYNKQDEDEQVGFFDPLLSTASCLEQLYRYALSA